MNEMDQVVRQAALVAALVSKQPKLGRTALMKYVYILQVVKALPLGFDFSLYAYGPYDGAVLSRLSTAVRWGAVKETPVHYPSGLGYELEPGDDLGKILDRDRAFFDANADVLDWVVQSFKDRSAGEMELIGTMVYVDQEAHELGEQRTKSELIDVVLKIKPHFKREQAERMFDDLKGKKMFVAIREEAAR